MRGIVRAAVIAACVVFGGIARGQDPPPDKPEKPDAPKPDKDKPDAPKGDKKKEKPLDDAAVKERLAKQKLTLNFADTPFTEAIAFFQDLSGLNYVIDPSVDANLKVTAKLKDVTVDAALKSICATGDVQFEVWRAVIYLGPKKAPKRPAPQAKLPDATAKTLDTKRMTLNFDGTPVADALAFVEELTGLDVAIDDAAKTLTVSLRVRDVSARTILELLCRQHGLKLEAADKGVKLVKR